MFLSSFEIAAVVLAVAAASVVIYLTRYYYRDMLFGPPVDFLEDEYIEIGLYPNAHRAALIFTCDDVTALTGYEKIANLVSVLEKYEVKCTFFVIPYFRGRYLLGKDSEEVKALKEAELRGHEIALHGLTHTSPRRKLLLLKRDKEFWKLPQSEQRRRIKVGKRILAMLGFSVFGFRSPAFSASEETLQILDAEEFTYSSDTRVRPIMLMSNRRFCESLYYPYHPLGLRILDFISNGDYFWGYDKLGPENMLSLKRRFDRYYENSGTFVLLSHIEPINSGSGLATLEKFLEYTKEKNLWKPTLRELAEWWLARENLFAVSEVKGDVLYITLEKGSELPLSGLTIKFKSSVPAKEYKIFDSNEVLIKEGRVQDGVALVSL